MQQISQVPVPAHFTMFGYIVCTSLLEELISTTIRDISRNQEGRWRGRRKGISCKRILVATEKKNHEKMRGRG